MKTFHLNFCQFLLLKETSQAYNNFYLKLSLKLFCDFFFIQAFLVSFKRSLLNECISWLLVVWLTAASYVRGALWCDFSRGSCVQPAHLCCSQWYLNIFQTSDYAFCSIMYCVMCIEHAPSLQDTKYNPVLTGVRSFAVGVVAVEQHTSSHTRLG